MSHLNLVVTFKVQGEAQFQVKGASRMKVDGRGAVTLFGGAGEVVDTIDLGDLQSLKIHSLTAPAALAA